MDLLYQIPTKRGVRKALEVLPNGIDKTYSEAWHRVCAQSPQQAELGKRILSWIIHATRPLKVQELRHALAIEDNDEEIDPDGLLDVATLTSFCAGLVIVDEQRGLFSLVHPTTQEYFDERKDVLFPAAHENIAATCITYLRMRPFRDEGASDDFNAFYKRSSTYHLFGYAAVNWGFHAARAGSEKAKDDSLSLINNGPVRAAAWQALQLYSVEVEQFGLEWHMFQDNYQHWREFDVSKSYSVALHIAASFGLTKVVQILLELGNDVNQLDGLGTTPLHWAIIGKHNTMLELLFEHGANANAEIVNDDIVFWRRWHIGSMYRLPLAIAVCLENVTAIKCLLHHGAEINKIGRGPRTATALSAALCTRCRAATQVLLENGASVDVGLESWAALAHMDGEQELMKMAVDAGASNVKIQWALVNATHAGNYDAIVLLVEHGADANGFGETLEPCNETDSLSLKAEMTPLIASIQSTSPKSTKCFQYLIDAGANVNRVCARLWQYADDYTDNSDGSLSMPIGRKTTALHTAAYHGRLNMMRTLVDRGADVNLSLGEQHTALSSALGSEGYSETDDRASDEFGPASSLRVRATVNLLVDLGADPQLCKDEEIQRIETLLKMSSDNRKMVAALQTVVEQPRHPNDAVHKKSFRDRVSELKELIAEGANPDLCCDRDKQQIDKLLACSEEKINDMDEQRTRRITYAQYLEDPI